MDPLKKISFIILSKETAKAKQIMYQIINSSNEQQHQLSIAMLPFFSSVCSEWYSFLSERNELDSLEIVGVPFEKIAKKTRVSYKLYSDKKINSLNNKLLKSSSERKLLLQSDYNPIQRLFVSLFGQEDLGIFTLNNIPYGNTSQLSIYLDEIFNLSPITSLKKFEQENLLILSEYARYTAAFIDSVTVLFKDSIDTTSKLSLDNSSLSHKDYFFLDEKRKNILGGLLPASTQLFLLNVLCQNNFINFVIPDIFKLTDSFYFRAKLQTYLTSINSLRSVIKKYPQFLSEKQHKLINQLILEKDRFFNIENKLRNNIFHYDLKHIPASIFIDPNRYFEELIEYSTNNDFEDFINKIDCYFVEINLLIQTLINYK